MWLNEQMRIGVFRNIETHALEVGRFFTFFYTNFTDYDTGHDFNPGIVLMGVFVISVFLYISGKLNKKAKLYFWFSFGFLFLSSDLFPWRLWGKTPIGYMMTSVQSPWRFVTYAVIFLVLLSGELYSMIPEHFTGEKLTASSLKTGAALISVLLLVITSSVFTSAYDEYSHDASYREGSELDTFFAGGKEYVPLAAFDQFPDTFEASEGTEIVGYSRDLNRFDINVDSPEGGYIDLPMIAYKGYTATDPANGRAFEVVTGPCGCVRISIPSGYSGRVYVAFREPMYWRLAEIVSLVSLIVILIRAIIVKSRLKRI